MGESWVVVGEGVIAVSVEIERVNSGDREDKRACFGDGVVWVIRVAVPTTGELALDEPEPVREDVDSLRADDGLEVA